MVWKTGKVRIDLNGEGIRELLVSDGVSREIEARAERVSGAANTRYDAIGVGQRDAGAEGVASSSDPTNITTSVHMGAGKTRARARVVADHPAARAIEAKHRVLGQSMDAAK
jgi:hypothetical protein